ncbi:hypothetical protein C0J52_10474 [Blattella germanica]|nr:hypothetical protein C0J52_10474 [Blattella germanica]
MEGHIDSDNVVHGPEDLYPPPDVTLGRFINQLLPTHEDRVTLVDADTGESLTSGEILTKSLSIAAYLHAQGVKPGDAIGICSENHLEFFLPVLASFFVGAACAPVNPMYTTRELEHVLNISKPKYIFCSETAVQSIDEISRRVNYIKGIIVFGKPAFHKHIPLSHLLQDKSNTFEPIDADPSELVAVILCSSGTTGMPKGVMLTHKNILTVTALIIDPRYFDRDPDDIPTTVGFLPFFHAMAFMNQLNQLMLGAKCIVMKKFKEDLFLKTIQNHKAIFSGAAPLSKETEIQMKNRVKAEKVGQGYGLTETTLGVLVSGTSAPRPGSVGRLVPATSCKVVDLETGKNLGPNKEGELCFKGPLIMKGYCGNPEATAEMIDKDGFLHTGDIGYYDEDCYFYIVDRIKELIKYKGYQVPPAELEAVLLNHPGIRDAGVTAVPDESAGELPIAFVVKEPGHKITKEEIIKYVEGQVSPQKRLRGGVVFIDSIPRTPSGKILRRQLKDYTKSKSTTDPVDAVTGETRTYAEILSKSLNVAKHLHARGLRCGDVIGICSENSLDYILPEIAVYFIGATCAPLNPTYSPRELLHAMSISKPRIIFCSENSLPNVEKACNQLQFLKDIVVLGKSSHRHIKFEDFLKDGVKDFQGFAEDDPKNHIAAILCSSGTTGFPKGVMLTAHSFLFVLAYQRDYRFGNMRYNDTMLALLPMFHGFMYCLQLTAVMIGVKIVVMNKFDEKLFLNSIQNHKITLLYLVPPIIVFLAKASVVTNYDLSTLRDIVSGAAPLKEEIEILAAERLGLQQIRQGYGLTENTLACTLTPTNQIRRGASGVLVPETECKVIDLETGKILGPNERGELCFRSPGIMKGYCGNLEETASTIDKDGFLHSGDVGYYDRDGFFYIVERAKELIKYKGFQVPPAELEALLLTHPEVREAAVIGKPDEMAGELPLAFVVKQPGAKVTKEDIIKFVADQTSPQKRLYGGVIFTDHIPKTVSGKILRRELKQLLKSNL